MRQCCSEWEVRERQRACSSLHELRLRESHRKSQENGHSSKKDSYDDQACRCRLVMHLCACLFPVQDVIVSYSLRDIIAFC